MSKDVIEQEKVETWAKVAGIAALVGAGILIYKKVTGSIPSIPGLPPLPDLPGGGNGGGTPPTPPPGPVLVCSPGTTYCDGYNLMKCKGDGSGWEFAETNSTQCGYTTGGGNGGGPGGVGVPNVALTSFDIVYHGGRYHQKKIYGGETFQLAFDVVNTGGLGEVGFKIMYGAQAGPFGFDECAEIGSPWQQSIVVPTGALTVYSKPITLPIGDYGRMEAAPWTHWQGHYRDLYVLITSGGSGKILNSQVLYVYYPW